MKKIRESTEEHLKENGCSGVPVFLIDSYEPWKFEFDQLKHHLIEEFPKLKKTALILSLQATSEKMIKLKVAELRSRIWKVAALSGAVAAVPLPGVSLAVDICLVAREAKLYYEQLGLDEVSLERYAILTSTNYLQLRAIVDSGLGFKVVGMEGFKQLVEILSKRAAPLMTSAAVEEGSRFIPLIGSFIAAPLSFGGTYYALTLVLNKMERVALEVIQFATESAAAMAQSADD